MKGKLLIVFNSYHGYVKRYVDIIGNALGCDAVPADKVRLDMFVGYDKILYIGSVRDNVVSGLKKFSDYFDAIFRRLIICGVGMTPYRADKPRRIKDSSISVAYEKFIPVFYVQGGFELEELSRTEKFSIAWKIRQIKTANILTDDDTFLMNAVNTPVDEVKIENIQPLIDYLDGKPVDEALYSPAEITDPAEQDAFFAELEQAAKEPAERKRDIKKKLRARTKQSDLEPETSTEPAKTEPAANEGAGEQPAEESGAVAEEN